MKYIKLFEDSFEDGDGFEGESVSDESLRKLLNWIYSSQGISREDDELEIMLKWSARQFKLSPDEVKITQIDSDRAKDIMQRGKLFASMGLRDLGKEGIDVLKYMVIITQEEYTEILDRIRVDHPELFRKRVSTKDQWRLIDLIDQIRSKQYGVVLAVGPAGSFVLTPRERQVVSS